MATPEELEQSIDQAVSGVFADTGQMVNRWVALVEVVGEDGDRGIWTFTSPGMKRWDALGMLAYGQVVEQTHDLLDHQDGGA